MFVNIYLGLAAFTMVGAAVVNDFSLISIVVRLAFVALIKILP